MRASVFHLLTLWSRGLSKTCIAKLISRDRILGPIDEVKEGVFLIDVVCGTDSLTTESLNRADKQHKS